MSSKACAVILAGGEGKRMKSDQPKVLSEVLFRPMLRWVIEAVRAAHITDICVVTGHKREYVEDYLSTLPFAVETVFQSERLGTGHAVMTALPFLERHRGEQVIVLNGDAPFVDTATVEAVLNASQDTVCTVVSAAVENPFGYGRIVREADGHTLCGIVEEKEADDAIRQIHEINSGVYCFAVDALMNALSRLTKSPKTGEYYLTDTIGIFKADGQQVAVFQADNADSVLGANDAGQLQELNEIARQWVLRRLLQEGVIIPCTDGIIVGTEVTIGRGTVLLPATVLRGQTTIGAHCEIGPAVLLEDTVIPDNSHVRGTTTVLNG